MSVAVGDQISGPAGKGWPIEILEHDRPDTTATVARFFLECPGQSAAWDRYGLSIVHLRPIAGVRPAYLRFPDATHEVLLVAYDPSLNPDPAVPSSWRMLRPFNLCEQVHLPDDRAARALLDSAAGRVVHGKLWAEPPLSGQHEPWYTYLRDSAAMLRAAATDT